ncbi:MAG: hypothetical protein HQ592_00980 [Planctomycetes bacterium]|nr:hypothetical protein [Planctomycetota bacterium]
MRVNCLSCGHKLELDDAYDDYEGQVKCYTCRAVLEIKAEEGAVKSVTCVQGPHKPTLEETFELIGG